MTEEPKEFLQIIKKHKQSSVAEFLYKNLHLLGFENTQRVFNVYFRELADNSLDAFMNTQSRSKDVKALIDITLKKDNNTNWWTLDWLDSGHGIPHEEVPKVVCKLLYGSKFQSTEIARGQQGLGCSSLMLWSQKTTDSACLALVKNLPEEHVHKFRLKTDLKKNEPIILEQKKYTSEQLRKDVQLDEHQKDLMDSLPHFSFLRFTFKGSYVRVGSHSPMALLRYYRYLNPEVEINYRDLSNRDSNVFYPAVKTDYVRPNLSVKRVPMYCQLGDLNTLKEPEKGLREVIRNNFEISEVSLEEVLRECHLSGNRTYQSLTTERRRRLLKVMSEHTCKEVPEFIDTSVNEALVNVVTEFGNKHFDYVMTSSSTPRYFQHGALFVNTYAFYGEKLSSEAADSDHSKIELVRVANDTPLIYGAHNCAIYKSVVDFDWSKLKLSHVRGQLPKGSMRLIISVKATKVPYATESKDYISNDLTIRESVTESLEKIAVQLKRYKNKLKQHEGQKQKSYVLTRVLPEVLKTLKALKDYCAKDEQDSKSTTQDFVLEPHQTRAVVSKIMGSLTIFVDKKKDLSVVINRKNMRQQLQILDSKSKRLYFEEIPVSSEEENVESVIPFAVNLKKHVLKERSTLDYFLVDADLSDVMASSELLKPPELTKNVPEGN